MAMVTAGEQSPLGVCARVSVRHVLARRMPPAQGGRWRAYVARLLVLLAMWMLSDGLQAVRAQSPSPTASQVKAAFLYHFTQFVEWPAGAFTDSNNSVILGVLGEDPFGAILDETMRGKTVHEKPLVVKRFASLEEAVQSHILFISASEESRLPRLLMLLEQAQVVTVSDIALFAERGGMIALRLEDKKVRFDINVNAVERAGLKMSSQLLKLAKIVSGKPRSGS